MSLMSDQSSYICACPTYMRQYHIPEFPIKSLDVYTQTYSETLQNLCHHIHIADADQGKQQVWSMCVLKKDILHAWLGAVFAEYLR